MSALDPNLSRDELVENYQLYSVLLESLNQSHGIDQGNTMKREYEGILREIDSRLGSRPQTPASQAFHLTTPRSGTSINLPSRDGEKQHPYSASPLHRTPGWGWPASSPSTSTAQTQSQKRHRNSLYASAADTHKKSRKNSDTPSGPSSTGTPTSLDSLDQVDREVEARQREREAEARKGPEPSYLARAREREAFFEQQKRDAEQARNMSRGYAPTFGQSSLPGPRSTLPGQTSSQSYFGRDGRIVKPEPITALEAIQLPSVFGNPHGAQVKQEPSWTNRPYMQNNHRGYTSTPVVPSNTHLGSSNKAPIMLDDDDDDDEYGYLHGAASSYQNRYPQQRGGNYVRGPSQHHPQHSSAFMDPTVRASSQYTLPPGRSSSQGYMNSMSGGSSVYNSAHNALLAGSRAVGNAMSSLYNSYAGGFEANPIDLDDDSDSYRSTLPTLEQTLHDRGLDYMLNDPARSREDLENLIENIRPDEEIPPEMRINSPVELRVALMEHQKLGLAWLQKQEESAAKGGILADDMGLGKTIQALALIATRRSSDPGRKTTLIVAPVALLRQWKREIDERMAPGHKLSCLIYHAQNKSVTFAKLSTYDVVMTTYGKLAAEYKRKQKFEERRASEPQTQRRPDEKLVLLDERSSFHRVIVDEAQNIKNHNTKSALGALYLRATYRLCMTGTPMMNNVSELFSLIRFLRVPPYNSQEAFNRQFKRPLENERGSDTQRNTAMSHLQALLKSIMLRRTKESKIDNRPILNLPPRSTEIVHAVFDEEQGQLYRALEQQLQLEMNKFLQPGKRLTNYSYVLVRLLRLRQACDHPHLIQDLSGEEAYSDVTPELMEDLAKKLHPDVITRIKEANGSFECPICYDGVENPSIFFPCGHDCCPDCFAKVTDPTTNPEGGHGAKCPECRQPLDTKKIIDFRSFKKVFMPDPENAEGAESATKIEEEAEDEDSDDSSDEDEDEDDDADSQGDLRDFIVDDDGDDDGEAGEAEQDEDDDPFDLGPVRVRGAEEAEESQKDEPGQFSNSIFHGKKKGKKSATKAKGKGKDKAKGKGKGQKKEKKRLTLAQLRVAGTRNIAAKKKYLRRLRKNYIPSAKIEKTMEIIKDIVANDPKEKVIIFSQFTSFLDLLELPIGDEGWGYRRYDGGMSGTMRNDAVMDFQDSKHNVKIMLVSLKAGNAGLNLTAASQVIILDPFWNPFIEEQAVDRAHRIGQMKPVQVHRMLVQETVEDRIVALQEKKRELIKTALDENAGRSLSRLGREELRYLFGLDRQP